MRKNLDENDRRFVFLNFSNGNFFDLNLSLTLNLFLKKKNRFFTARRTNKIHGEFIFRKTFKRL